MIVVLRIQTSTRRKRTPMERQCSRVIVVTSCSRSNRACYSTRARTTDRRSGSTTRTWSPRRTPTTSQRLGQGVRSNRWIHRRKLISRRGWRSSRWRYRPTRRSSFSSGRRCLMRRRATRGSSRGGGARMSLTAVRYSYFMLTPNHTYAQRRPQQTLRRRAIR
jgi:hypothetical protein